MPNPTSFFRRIAIVGTAAVTCFAALGATAQEPSLPISDCLSLVGTYLTDDTDDTDTQTARSLISITNGGHAFFTDSGEQGSADFAPFGDARGAWRCISNDDGGVQFKAIVLDFTQTTPDFPNQQIGRLDITGTFDADNGRLSGTMALHFFPLDGDPLGDIDSDPDFSGEYTAVRVTAP